MKHLFLFQAIVCLLLIPATVCSEENPGVPKPLEFKADPNSDGKPFQSGESALLEFVDIEQDVLKKDAKVFTDRNYVVNQFPKQLEGMFFARGSIDGCMATCRGAGMVYVLTPVKTRNKDSVVDELEKQGFEKVAAPETLLFGNIVGNIVTMYQKKAKDGEKIRFGKWAVFVYGKKGTTTLSADSLQPAMVLKPIPVEYGDEHRLFQGIPSMALAPNGRVWANWYTGGDTEGDENYVLAATSGDLGQNWSKPLFAIDIPGPVRAYDPALWTDPDGRVWLFWAQSKKWWDGRSGVWCMTSDNADREDAAWSAPRRLCDGIMMCKPIVDSKGRWLAPVSIWTLDPKHADKTLPEGANVMVSEDKGKTWKHLGGTVIPKENAIFDEHMLVEKKDGTLWMLIRTKSGIAESFSTDGGKTWSDPTPSVLPHPSARFFIRRLKSKNLLLVKHGPLDKRTGRSHLTAYLSGDDGKSWKGGLMLDERNGVSYPDGDQTADGTILVIYDFDRTGDKEILMARFTESDVLAGKIESPKGALRLLVNKSTAKKNR